MQLNLPDFVAAEVTRLARGTCVFLSLLTSAATKDRLNGALLAAVLVSFSSGCASSSAPRDYHPTWARFFLESSSADGTPLKLPKSEVSLVVNTKPVITEGDILDVELVQVDLGKCLMFQLTPAATRDFYRLSVMYHGRRLALVVDGAALGARRIDGAITNGAVYVFVELPDDALPALVENLKKSATALQKEIARKG
jgi:hypothetical protein